MADSTTPRTRGRGLNHLPYTPRAVDALADITLPDQDGTPTRLGDLWADGPVALIWLRHYG
jgi:hypothetical protein